ncbi:TetR/AcrR family transcriptional regulator C-terminal domain-containing protein [Amycolatopsis sp. NPDC023774]|uniref:TetR/AcrR family transcriptional regulator C-terminal domain-containing protein n=1 Tax=Amycolatopsis sp. NPDC023774 TaxID=3155015 RepID=UPI0033D9DB83
MSFTTFATGFVARPLGGAIFGHVGDRIELSSCEFDLCELREACVDVLTSPATVNLHSVLEAEAKRFPEDTATWLGRVPAELRRVLETAVHALPGIRVRCS